MTNDLVRGVWQHKTSSIDGFTSKYRVDRLLYFEDTSEVVTAIQREKQIKGWSRAKKIALIEQSNPMWDDLAVAWYDAESVRKADSSLCSE